MCYHIDKRGVISVSYHEALDCIIRQYKLSAKEISSISDISPSTISRFRKGTRQPDAEAARCITAAVLHLIEAKGTVLTDEQKTAVRQVLNVEKIIFRTEHFDLLVSKLNLSMTELAQQINYSLPYLSEIRSGRSQPADRERFLRGLCAYLKLHRQRDEDWRILSVLTGCREPSGLSAALEQWLWGTDIQKQDGMGKFLRQLDSFDLNQYMTMFHFEPPAIPENYDVSVLCRDYIGTEQMRQAELNFFRMTLLSGSTEPIFMHNEMSLSDMARDEEFNKNWMLSVAMCLKKGLHLDIIHDIDRPTEEMLLGLQAWIPLYMTGQISPYYLRTSPKGLYRVVQYLSGAAYLGGICISHDDAYYALTNQKEQMQTAAVRRVNALKSAQPLMEIYNSETRELYDSFVKIETQGEGKRIALYPSLPLYTLSEELLTAILDRNSVAVEEQAAILQSYHEALRRTERILEHSEVSVAVPDLSAETFSAQPLCLSLTDSFFNSDFTYTWEEYRAHLALTEAFTQAHENYQLLPQKSAIFRNIRIKCKLHDWVMISKSNAPTTHFVLRHPKMIAAIENFCIGQCYS